MPSSTTHSSRPTGISDRTGGGFANVLCAIDGFPDSRAAVAQAAALTAAAGRLTLLAVTSFRTGVDRGSPAVGPGEAKETIDGAVEILKRAGIEHDVEVDVEVDPAGPPSHVVLDWAAGRGLLAIGAPKSSTLGAVFVKGVGDYALGSFTTPLLIARPTPGGGRFAERILIASDALERSQEMVDVAGCLARDEHSSVTLLHATGSERGVRAHGADEHERRIEEQTQRLRELTGGLVESRLAPAGARTAILDTAREVDASLIVMSSRRLKGMRTLGSVSRHVAHHAHCSVLLIAPEHDN
ncbi:MAG TPA: universal stress protein [Solirubrobacteraceae bacterium]